MEWVGAALDVATQDGARPGFFIEAGLAMGVGYSVDCVADLQCSSDIWGRVGWDPRGSERAGFMEYFAGVIWSAGCARVAPAGSGPTDWRRTAWIRWFWNGGRPEKLTHSLPLVPFALRLNRRGSPKPDRTATPSSLPAASPSPPTPASPSILLTMPRHPQAAPLRRRCPGAEHHRQCLPSPPLPC